MIQVNFLPIFHPIDLYNQLSTYLGNPILYTTSLIDDLREFKKPIEKKYFDSISFHNDSNALVLECIFPEKIVIQLPFQFTENWFVINIHFDKNNTLLTSVMYAKQLEDKNINQSTLTNFEENVSRTWTFHPNKSVKNIIFFLKEEKINSYFSPLLSQLELQKYIGFILTKKEILLHKDSHEVQLISQLFTDELQNKHKAIIRKNLLEHLLDNFLIQQLAANTILQPKNKNTNEVRLLHLTQQALLNDFSKPPPTLDVLARMAGMNRQKFQQQFKEYYGVSFYQYYQAARFEYAKKLIEQKGYNSIEAASAIGFKNYSHFIRLFTKYFGLKPSSIKNTH